MKRNISFHENNSKKVVIYMTKDENYATYLTYFLLLTDLILKKN